MSTRCQVIVKEGDCELWFYRHSDGYPEGVKATLDKFCGWMRDGLIRKDAMQAAGWLVLIGAQEYDNPGKPVDDIGGWKVGAYEPCEPSVHGDIDHLYVVDVNKASWKEDKWLYRKLMAGK